MKIAIITLLVIIAFLLLAIWVLMNLVEAQNNTVLELHSENKRLHDENIILFEDTQALHIANVMRCLKQDPVAGLNDINYSHTEEYLWELIEKNGSVLHGLIIAMEKHLEK